MGAVDGIVERHVLLGRAVIQKWDELVAYIADISSMPAAITRMFAVPAMRKYGYRVLLDRESRVVPRFPGDADKVLWVTLDHGRFVSQREFSDANALRDALKAKAR